MSDPNSQLGNSDGQRRVCLDLFSGLGGREDVEHGFSSAFQVSDRWEVVTVDIREEFAPDLCVDVLDLRPSDLRDLLGDYDVLVILAGHPCTLFSTAGNHDEWDLEARAPVGERAQRHTAMLFHTLGLIRALAPDYWYLENPKRSRINWLIGPPEATVTYCQYGMSYQKPTGLWGDHAPGMTYKSCPRGANCHASNTDDDGTSAVQSMPSDTGERSLFPRELSEAIRDAVEKAIENPPPVQSELPLVTDGGTRPKNEVDRVVITQCTGSKRNGKHPARDLYDESDYFRKQRAYAESNADEWFIQSALYGLLRPDDIVESYDKHAKDIADPETWAAEIAADLSIVVPKTATVEVLGGSRYADPLTPELERLGFEVIEPLRGQRIGKRKQSLVEKMGSSPGGSR